MHDHIGTGFGQRQRHRAADSRRRAENSRSHSPECAERTGYWSSPKLPPLAAFAQSQMIALTTPAPIRIARRPRRLPQIHRATFGRGVQPPAIETHFGCQRSQRPARQKHPPTLKGDGTNFAMKTSRTTNSQNGDGMNFDYVFEAIDERVSAFTLSLALLGPPSRSSAMSFSVRASS